MRTLPTTMIRLLMPFAPLFSKSVWRNAQVLLMGAILAPGRRTVSSALRAMGLDRYERFHRYHRVLSHASWSSLKASRVLLGLLVEIPWAARVWALPFLSALAPSERYAAKRGKRHKKITEWAWQLLLMLRRWYPKRKIVAVADRAYASLKLLDQCRKLTTPITFITRLRLDAALYEPAPPRRPHQIGRPRIKGERLPNLSVVVRDRQGEFKTQALLCTDLDADPKKIVSWFVMRWQLEVTFQEVRRHLGFETQRQWSELAIRRTTPALLGMFSVVTLFAPRRMVRAAGAFRRAAWYHKAHPTFADALALVRKELWANATFCGSPPETDTVKVPRAYLERLTDAVCY